MGNIKGITHLLCAEAPGMRQLLPKIALLLATTFPIAALANPITGGAGGFSGTGTLITSSNGDGSYTIIDITGTGITGLIAPGGFNGNNNQLYPTGDSFVDASGFSFSDVLGNTAFSVNLFFSAGTYSIFLTDSDGVSMTLPVDFTVGNTGGAPTQQGAAFFHHQNAGSYQDYTFSFDSPTVTPEPSSVFLMGTGLIVAAGLAGRRKLS